MNLFKVQKELERFFIEDIGDRDITSESIFPPSIWAKGAFTAKSDGVIAGLPLIKEAYHLFDSSVEIDTHFTDGQAVKSGDVIAEVRGPVVHLLAGERVILNLLQRMSGIATLTKKSVQTLADPSVQICDTRKTMPGLRMFEKYAVRTGGGKNHRFGLYDGVMIKDNHIAFCGSITKAIQRAREASGHMVRIEVETETKDEILEAAEAGADVIMFDNCSPDQIRAFASIVPSGIVTEASGGITLENLADYHGTNVDHISLGYLTHSATSLDISLNVHKGE